MSGMPGVHGTADSGTGPRPVCADPAQPAGCAFARHPAPLEEASDLRLLAAIQHGLPLVPSPYAELGRQAGLSESEVIQRLEHWIASGIIKRLGVIVRHRQLGYRANAMVVFDVPDGHVGEIGRRLAGFACVTLCYQRPRRGDDWPYNLFCMIHGRDRLTVEAHVEALATACGLARAPRAVLFSRRCFKQRGAVYRRAGPASGGAAGEPRRESLTPVSGDASPRMTADSP